VISMFVVLVKLDWAVAVAVFAAAAIFSRCNFTMSELIYCSRVSFTRNPSRGCGIGQYFQSGRYSAWAERCDVVSR
jgi:hypothetical protein